MFIYNLVNPFLPLILLLYAARKNISSKNSRTVLD